MNDGSMSCVSAQAKKIIVIDKITSLKELVSCRTLHHERFCFMGFFSPQLRLRREDDPSIAMIATSIVNVNPVPVFERWSTSV